MSAHEQMTIGAVDTEPVRHPEWTDDNWLYLHTKLKRNAAARAELDADEATLLLEAEEAQLWRKLGHGSMYDYLERELGYAPRTARERLRVAHALRDLPQVFDQLASGALCYSAVRELTRVATRETEDAWLGATEGKALREIEELVSGHKLGDAPDAPVDVSLIRKPIRFEVSPATFAMIRETRATTSTSPTAITDARRSPPPTESRASCGSRPSPRAST